MLRLGAVAYLNMQPLIHGLAPVPGELELRLAPPSVLAEWLAAGTVDVAMVPVAALFAHPEWAVLPAPPGAPARATMIGSRGAVRSVILAGGGQPYTWRALRLDSHSRTSNVLAQVVLDGHLSMKPELLPPEPALTDYIPTTPEPGLAQVLIGSRALEWVGRYGEAPGRRADGWHWLDLGEVWTHWTGKPMVYAVWAVRPGVELGDWPARLEALKCANLARIPQVAAAWPRLAEEGLTVQTAAEYLTRNIDFDLTAEAETGLCRFHAAGAARGLFPAAWTLRWA